MKFSKFAIRRLPGIILTYGWLILVSFFTATPFIWMLTSSFKQRKEIFTRVPVLLPRRPTLINYRYIFTETPAGRYALNSLFIASTTVVLALVITTLGAYALSRFRFKARRHLGTYLIGGQMFPAVLMLIPVFTLLARLELVNTYFGLILINTMGTLPFCTWMLKGYFDTVPVELEESAMIDGCGRLSAIARVFLPVAAPGIAAVALFAFTNAWQEFMFALTMMKDMEKYTLSVGINFFVGIQGTVVWGNIMAMAVLIVVPGLIFFLFLQRYMISGLTAGAVKG
jgi:ABC-type glycerol-3-phosphate transport system permease component